jgi:hypothetical protein
MPYPGKRGGHLPLILAAALMTFTGSASAAQNGSVKEPRLPPTKDLSAFEDTYWYVPDDYLLAYRYTNLPKPKVEAVVDQTVWHLTKANEGYLLGCSFRTINDGQSWSTSKIVGSVAPNDQVVMGFNNGKIINVASGTLISSRGQSVFLMQVAGTPPQSSLTHWAYMVQVTPDDAAWCALPGTSNLCVDDLVKYESGCVADP